MPAEPVEPHSADSGREGMCRVDVVGVRLELPSSHPVVVLQEIEPPYRELPIPTGYPEGMAIAYAWRHVGTPRPLTHETMTTILEQFAMTLEAVEITGVHDGIFYAQLTVVGGSSKRIIQCRPSDAIALALRQILPVPMLVDRGVMELEAGAPET